VVTAKARDLIDRQVHHMSRLVSDLLDAARAENGQIKLQRSCVDLRASVEAVVDLMRPGFESKQQTLRVNLPDDPIWVEGDSTRLEQILTNLLSNANKYTQERGDIELNLRTTVVPGARPHALVQVIDNGDGIDADLVPHLFELFTQADRSLAHSQGGLGIGLSLVRTLVAIHSDGRGKGSTFELRIPVSDPPRAVDKPIKTVAAARPDVRRSRILIVDDNKDVRESTSELLAIAGFEVRLAATGYGALEMASRFGPAAILLDLGLPDLSGYDVARRLRQMPQFGSTLLIALTGYDTPEAHVMSSAAGFDHHIAKPVNFDELTLMLG
jgi:CheY-like chemotaxis protein